MSSDSRVTAPLRHERCRASSHCRSRVSRQPSSWSIATDCIVESHRVSRHVSLSQSIKITE
eukprot:318437-Rhodomonas_salina.1